MPPKKTYTNIADLINGIADEINTALEEKQKEKYFEGVVLLYSFLENILKWLVFVKLLWNKADRLLADEEVKAIRNYSKGLNFYNAAQLALALDVIDVKLHKRIDNARAERNDIVHQFWLYAHRGNRLVLRKKLEKLARLTSDVVERLNTLVQEIGVDETLEIAL